MNLCSFSLSLFKTIAVPMNDAVSEYAMAPSVRQQKYSEAQAVKVAGILEKMARYHMVRGPQEADLAAKRSKEKDTVLRLVRR